MNYEVPDSWQSSLFGAGREDEWREEEKPVLLVCVDASLPSALTSCGDLAPAAPVGVALPTSPFRHQHAQSWEKPAAVSKKTWKQPFRDCLWYPLFRKAPFNGEYLASGSAELLRSFAGKIHRMLLGGGKKIIQCNSCGDKQHTYKR